MNRGILRRCLATGLFGSVLSGALFAQVPQRIGCHCRPRLVLTQSLIRPRLFCGNGREPAQQILNRRLCSLIPEPELADIVGQACVSDFQPTFVQPRPDIFQAMASRQEVLDAGHRVVATIFPCTIRE